MKRRILFGFIILLIGIALCILPAAAKIQDIPPNVQYDADGTTPAFGEEIHITQIISLGETDIKNLVIDLKDADAFIDDSDPTLITLTSSPAGTSVPISQKGKTFTVDQLQKGQTIILAFNAYPKTLQKQTLHVADIGISYTQMGDRIGPIYTPITAQMDKSSWFLLQKAQSQNDFTTKVFYGSVVLILAACAVFAFFIIKRREYTREYAALKEKRDGLIRELIRKVDLAENNPAEFDSLKTKLRNELSSDNSSARNVSTSDDAKKPPRDIRGGFE